MKPNFSIENYIKNLPKAELHIHIEGSFEPELMFKIAKRNGIALPYNDVESLKSAYNFSDLQSFLDIYYQGASVLITENDFFDLTYAYLKKVHDNRVVHVEMFFDPQTHTHRGVGFDTMMKGITSAMEKAKKEFGISSLLIMSFLRHLSEAEAFETLELSLPWRKNIIGLGLDSSERGNPPQKFEKVFKKGKELGFKLMAHAGEEGPADYVNDTVDFLKVDRIDHGNRCIEDDVLVLKLAKLKMPLTICPLSNLKLKVVKDMKSHPLKKLLQKSLIATVNSDDPAYFGGYINENYIAVSKSLHLTKEEINILAINSFEASFLDSKTKTKWIKEVKKYNNNF